jgi:hypothetical protein
VGFSVGLVMGMVVMVPLTGSLFLMLVACFPRRREVVEGRVLVAQPYSLDDAEPEHILMQHDWARVPLASTMNRQAVSKPVPEIIEIFLSESQERE